MGEPNPLTVSDLHAMFEAARFRPRDLAILWTLAGTGMRVGELVGLRVRDIDFEDGVVTIRWEKHRSGRDRRQCTISPAACAAVRAYLDVLPEYHADDVLFFSRLGKRMTTRSVQRLVSGYGVKAGLPDAVTPHCFRHAFATIAHEAGAGLVSTQHQLGHAKESTTAGYIRASAGSPRMRRDMGKAWNAVNTGSK